MYNEIDYLEKELFMLLEWIKAADTRISLILPLSTAMVGAIAALFSSKYCLTTVETCIILFSLVCLFFSIFSITMASFPRVHGPKSSMIFFSTIKKKKLEDYRLEVNSMTKVKYKNDLINQCHVNAQIAEAKFFWVRISMISLLISSIPWFLSIYYLYS